MPTYATLEEAVQHGASIFGEAEAKAKSIRAAFRDLDDVFKKVRDEGHIGGIECMALSAEADALATSFFANLTSMHANLTNIAKDKGIDLPAIESGGR